MPSPDRTAVVAYDSARGRVVLFGGNWDLADTWEWDGVRWIKRASPTTPPARWGHAMAYDSARGRVVLFGGYGAGYLNDTWEWDGTMWVERTPATSPPARDDHAMAYDSASGRVLLFGGYGSGGILGDTWEWDGTTWTQRTPAHSPSPRTGFGMAYDSARGRVVLFGGVAPGGDLGDTWEWNGGTWIQQSPTISPPPRSNHAMAYDSAHERVVLFGGGWPDELGGGVFDDTWEWDGSAWVERTPSTSPPPRTQHAMVYDSARGKVSLFGGGSFGGGLFTDTWEWDGTDWADNTSPPGNPLARSWHTMTYDGARGRVVLFGGQYAPADTWEWDGSTWVERPPTINAGHYLHAMAYDSARGRVVLFGGEIYQSDTREWDGNAWLLRAPVTRPTGREGHGMVYDSARERVVLFGGRGLSTNFFGDTWEWDGNDWVQQTPAIAPSPRSIPAMAYDSARQRVVLFGGSGGGALTDMWEYDGTTWIQAPPGIRPPYSNRMIYDSARERVVLFAGSQLNGIWDWDGSTWQQRPQPASLPSPRDSSAIAYDSARDRVVTFGGTTSGTDPEDTWEYGPIEGCGHATSEVTFLPGGGTDATSGLDALGAPDGQVVSLGFGGSLVLELDPPLRDGPGTDLIVHALGTFDENYRVEVSQDDASYAFIKDCPGRECQIDLAANGVSNARYVRITDLPPDEGVFPDGGADIDGVTKLNCELCNGVDDDGDGIIPPDEIDLDGDGYVQCAAWSGTDPAIDDGRDCGPTDASIHPGAPEVCDGKDDDCNGVLPVDEADYDGDGVAICAADCDDTAATVFPGAPELCDGLANDCAAPDWPTPPPDEVDADGDGWPLCAPDCDDDPDRHPGIEDICNQIDDDCDGLVDEGGESAEDPDGDGLFSACDNCPTVANPSQSDGDGQYYEQWAASATASSQYSSGDYSAAQAAGPPENVGFCEDQPTNWSPLGSSADPEWLELSYGVPSRVLGVDVHESLEQGFVRQIELHEVGGMYHVAWDAPDDTTCGDVLGARWTLTPYAVDRVVVHTAVAGWEEVDAVKLLGVYDATDGVGDACDNCPGFPNIGQGDSDGDGAGDPCDCAPNDPAVRPAAEVSGLTVEALGGGGVRLGWDPAAGAATYAIVRGDLSSLSATSLGDCHIGGLATLAWDDAQLPPPDGGFSYLVRGESPVCGPGTLGFGAFGVTRFDGGAACPQ